MDTPDGARAAEHYGPAALRHHFERGTDGPRVIMVGVDGSRTADHAAAYAAGLARRQRCRLVVVFVGEPVGLVSAVYAEAATAVVETRGELADELRREVRLLAEEAGVPTTFLVCAGDPCTELRATADQVKADLLVIGASRQSGRWFVGSVATQLVRLGRWPVVVVP
ncbi:universal stress protein A [Catellatospora methionotrophica]|uniref:Universal stress protein A n=1 Tax=Catellatospora methionotrophica TaxID=121620 RepID=A0A8J3LHI7_9ACTN|nr:universal stress protein [Catellatospora methionotrophica]GIG18433.1 universal stress protein A [Catellatospora methionotrophica]